MPVPQDTNSKQEKYNGGDTKGKGRQCLATLSPQTDLIWTEPPRKGAKPVVFWDMYYMYYMLSVL